MKGYHGLLLVDKPTGMTSHDVVAKVRRWMNFKSIGHAGTLDPLATGLMVLLVGKGTKISDYILNGDKAYNVRVQLGIQTDTDDITGDVVAKQVVNFQGTDVEAAALSLKGVQELTVPVYSAIKQKGKKLYEMAREKTDFVPPKRQMTFREIEILESGSHWVEAHLLCSKGTYVRSWARAIGERMGVGATVETLRRTDSEPYSVKDAVSLEALVEPPFREEILQNLEAQGAWIPLSQALPQWPSLRIEGKEEKLLVNGQIPRRLERFMEIEYGGKGTLVPGIKILSKRSGQLLSLISHEAPLEFKIRRVFPNS